MQSFSTATTEPEKNRKKRTTISMEMIKSIRKDLEKNYSVLDISKNENISLQAAYKVVHKISEGLKDEEILKNKKGRRKSDKTELKCKVSQILIADASYTQSEIAKQLNETGHVISNTGVCRLLHEMDYTRKRLVRIPEERNSPKNIETRQTYAREIQFVSDSNLVFLDETGANMHHSRNYGYSAKNVKAYKVVKSNRGVNISCMVAISNTGIIGFEIKDGAFDGSSFKCFIQDKLVRHFEVNRFDILIMDNCSFHHRKDVLQLLDDNNIRYRFLPPYSPQLNPIEEYFSHFKSKLSSMHPFPADRKELKELIESVLQNDNVNFNGWFLHMRNYIQKALSRHVFI